MVDTGVMIGSSGWSVISIKLELTIDVQFKASVTIKEYVPDSLLVIFGILGFDTLDAKPFGPDHA